MYYVVVQVKERPDVGVYVKGLSSFIVKSPSEMEKLMAKGNKSRKNTVCMSRYKSLLCYVDFYNLSIF